MKKVNYSIHHMLPLAVLATIILSSCNEVYKHPLVFSRMGSSIISAADPFDSSLIDQSGFYPNSNKIYTGSTRPEQVLAFGRTLMGTPYVWGATDPATGFDCSGFITYLFNHFNIQVPRTTIYFSNIEREVPLATALPGDLVLFTGTDSATENTIGHMGIIDSSAGGQLYFMHASSGKAMGVTVSPLDIYYKGRFVKLIRIFPEGKKEE